MSRASQVLTNPRLMSRASQVLMRPPLLKMLLMLPLPKMSLMLWGRVWAVLAVLQIMVLVVA
jgi:hypothetical protein